MLSPSTNTGIRAVLAVTLCSLGFIAMSALLPSPSAGFWLSPPLPGKTGLQLLQKAESDNDRSRCPPDEEIEIKNTLRKRQIEAVCERLRLVSKELPLDEALDSGHLLMSHNYRFIYGVVPKGGSTNIMHYIHNRLNASNDGKESSEDVKLLSSTRHRTKTVNSDLQDMSEEPSVSVRKEKWLQYKKVTFFRDPLTRLVSGWRSKVSDLAGDTYFLSRKLRIIRYLRERNFPEVPVDSNTSMPLALFFRYLATVKDGMNLDGHWRPQHLLVHPCEMKYDYIGFVDDDMPCDLEYFMRKLTGRRQVPRLQTGVGGERYNITELLAQVDPHLVYQVLEKHYATDYDLMGYPFPQLPSGKSTTNN